MLRQLAIFLALGAIAATTRAQAPPPTPEQLHQWLQAAHNRSGLITDGAPPFHLVATIQLVSANGSATTGTMEETWKDRLSYKFTVKIPDRALVEIANGVTAWRTGNYNFDEGSALPLGFLLYFFFQPMHPNALTTHKVSLRPAFHNIKNLDCVGTQPELAGVSPEQEVAETTYCLAPGNHILRRVDSPEGAFIAFDDVAPFGNRLIARTVTLSAHDQVVARLHIDKLETVTDFSALDTPAPEGAQILAARPQDETENSAIMYGQLLNLPSTHDKTQSIFDATPIGMIQLLLHVDTTGSVTSGEILHTDNPPQNAWVLQWIKRLHYRAGYQNGRLVPFTTEFTLDFGGRDK